MDKRTQYVWIALIFGIPKDGYESVKQGVDHFKIDIFSSPTDFEAEQTARNKYENAGFVIKHVTVLNPLGLYDFISKLVKIYTIVYERGKKESENKHG